MSTLPSVTDREHLRGLVAGTPVVVRNRYVGAWSRGFEVAERLDGGYRIRRTSDGSVFPEVFAEDDVRA